MEEDIEPIFDFQPLRDFLENKGYHVKEAQGYHEVRPEVITPGAIRRGEIEFTDEGIYAIRPGKEKQQVYLYKQYYRLYDFGKPRFHICKCSVIESFIERGAFHENYVRANSDPVPVYNMDKGNEREMVDKLPLCAYCSKIIEKYGNINSSKFVEILRQARGEEEIQEVDLFGYTRDWDNISREYKEKKDYTCEKCGLHISNKYDRQYMHAHHIDANKLNNKESNLKCLCLRCHANVDEIHYRNLTTGANRIIWKAFNSAYPDRNYRPRTLRPTINI